MLISPLLDPNQIGEVSIDFRLGYEFLVSIQGRGASIEANLLQESNIKKLSHFFQSTRRRPGETFLLHPSQTILGVTLEYVKLPSDVYLQLITRSSYSRLGLSISSFYQPGYTGCLSIELTNTSKNAINLTVGSRIFQGIFFRTPSKTNYYNKKESIYAKSGLHCQAFMKIKIYKS